MHRQNAHRNISRVGKHTSNNVLCVGKMHVSSVLRVKKTYFGKDQRQKRGWHIGGICTMDSVHLGHHMCMYVIKKPQPNR